MKEAGGGGGSVEGVKLECSSIMYIMMLEYNVYNDFGCI
jgi:hypothetical protein